MIGIPTLPGSLAEHSRTGLHIFADGCFEPVSAAGGWGFVACRDAVQIASGFGGVQGLANNAMELIALLNAAKWIEANASGEAAVIWSDSHYAVTGCNSWRHIWKTNGWKKINPNAGIRNRKIADRDLWMAINAQLSHAPLVTIAWCKGHSGVVGNEKADELAEIGRLSLRNADCR